MNNAKEIINFLDKQALIAKEQNGTTELNVGYITGLKQAAYIIKNFLKEVNNESNTK